MDIEELKQENWKKFKSYMDKNKFTSDGNGTYMKKTQNGKFRYIIHKHSVQYEKQTGIGKWKKLNIGVWYIKDLKIINNQLCFARNDLIE